MPFIDPDAADPRLVGELVAMYEASARRLRQIVMNPPGSTSDSQKFNQARANVQLSQVNDEIARLRKSAAEWTGKAIQASAVKGRRVADAQAREAGIRPRDSSLQGHFSLVNREAVATLAQDTMGDLLKAANNMRLNAEVSLRHMAATGVTRGEVNRLLAGGIIEGQPQQATLQLRQALEKVHGEEVTVPTASGGTRTYDTKFYAKMVATTKMREAVVTSKHTRLQSQGMDLVQIIGRRSIHPCTMLLGKIFSLSGASRKYPAYASVSQGQEPYRLYHPFCTKSTAPFIEGLSIATSRGEEAEAA